MNGILRAGCRLDSAEGEFVVSERLLLLGRSIIFASVVYASLRHSLLVQVASRDAADATKVHTSTLKRLSPALIWIATALSIGLLLSTAGFLAAHRLTGYSAGLIFNGVMNVVLVGLVIVMWNAHPRARFRMAAVPVVEAADYTMISVRLPGSLLGIALLAVILFLSGLGFASVISLTGAILSVHLIVVAVTTIAGIALVTAMLLWTSRPSKYQFAWLARRIGLVDAQLNQEKDALVYRLPNKAYVVRPKDVHSAVVTSRPLSIVAATPLGKLVFDGRHREWDKIAKFILQSSSEMQLKGSEEELPENIRELLEAE